MSDLTLRRVPWNLFIAAAILASGGVFLLFHLLAGDLQDLSVWKGHWWQYFLACGFLGLSAGVVLSSRVEFVTFSRSRNVFQVTKYLPLWAFSEEQHSLTDIEDMFIYEKGQFTCFENTLRYYISLRLKWGRCIKLLETQSLRSIRLKATSIRDYLNLKGDPVIIRYR